MSATLLSICSDDLCIEVSPLGAELWSIFSTDGVSWLWNGDPAHWTGRAPILFPVIGRSLGGRVEINGNCYSMPLHGIAWTSEFQVHETAHNRCRLQLAATPESHACYPFDFLLDVSFEVKRTVLLMQADVVNLEDRPIPVCVGFHPAFHWPLPGCSVDELHVCRLDHRGSPRIRRLDENGLMLADPEACLFTNGVLQLEHALFDRRAIILDRGAGSMVHYGVPGKPGIEVTYGGLSYLGIWSKPNAPFLCIEPWQGLPPLAGASAALDQRPGVAMVAPGATHHVAMALRFGAMVPTN